MARGAIRIDWFPTDALNGMKFLTVMEELAYRRIIDLLYISGGELPDDDEVLAEQTRTFADWSGIKAGLLRKGKINVENGAVTNARCTEILTAVVEKSEKARASGRASARRRQLLPQRSLNERSTDGGANGQLSQGVRESVRETDVSLTARADFGDFVRAYPKAEAVMAARPVWDRAVAAGTDPAVILAGLERWKAHWRKRIRDPGDDFKPRHIRNAARWLDEAGWLDPDPDNGAAPRLKAWAGPPGVRAAVVAEAGEDFARSYLDPASWDRDGIRAATAYAVRKLTALKALASTPIHTHPEARP